MLTAAKSEKRRAKSRKRSAFLVLSFSLFALRCSFSEGPGDPHFQAGLAYERLGRYDESYTELQLAFAVDQDNAGLALALGVVASRLGRTEVAQRALERSVALDSDSEASYYQLALLYEKKGADDRAADAWHRFLSLSPDQSLKGVAERHITYLESHHS